MLYGGRAHCVGLNYNFFRGFAGEGEGGIGGFVPVLV